MASRASDPSEPLADPASGPPWIFGLRGAPREAPENTLAGLQRALALGLDGLAYDVRACAEGELVLLADANLDRTTDAHGPLALRSLRELHGVDAGGWFSKAFAGTPLAWLDEALALRGGAAAGSPQHLIELREPAALHALARRLKERGERLSIRVATSRRSVALEARDLGLAPLLVLSRASEDDRRFARDERLAAVGARPGGWRTLSAAASWPCERFCLEVDAPDELLAACRLPFNGLTTSEPRRALATRTLVRLAPQDRGAYPLQTRELILEAGSALAGESEWSGSWASSALVRNPFEVEVRVALEFVVRRGAFEARGLPHEAQLAPAQELELPFEVRGGSWSPGGDPLLVAHFAWGAGAEQRLTLDAPLQRVRVTELQSTPVRLPLLRESPNERTASVTLRRHRGDLLVAIEDAGGLADARLVVHLDGEVRGGAKGLRWSLPADFDARPEGVAFSVGIAGRAQTAKGPRETLRRWAGGLPDVVSAGSPGRLRPGSRG